MSIDAEIRGLGEYRTRRCVEIATEGENDGISGALLLAIMSRETNMRNINSPDDSDRGVGQINAYWHKAFLSSVPGCEANGSWSPTYGKTAYDSGYCPRFTDTVRYMIQLLRDAQEFAADKGVPASDRVRFSVAAYNTGAGSALRGYREGDVDKYTTGKNYSADVLARRTQVNSSRLFKEWKA